MYTTRDSERKQYVRIRRNLKSLNSMWRTEYRALHGAPTVMRGCESDSLLPRTISHSNLCSTLVCEPHAGISSPVAVESGGMCFIANSSKLQRPKADTISIIRCCDDSPWPGTYEFHFHVFWFFPCLSSRVLGPDTQKFDMISEILTRSGNVKRREELGMRTYYLPKSLNQSS